MTTNLRQVTTGMKVSDATGQEIGTVDWVQLSDEDPATPQAETATAGTADGRSNFLVERLAELFRNDSLPEVLQERLRRKGFVRIDASGLFAADRYVMPEQIREVSGDRVVLNVARDDLVKR